MKKDITIVLLCLIILTLPACGKREENPAYKGMDWKAELDGKIAFDTSRGTSDYSAAVYEDGEIKIIDQDGGGVAKWAPSGTKLFFAYNKAVELYHLPTYRKEVIPAPTDMVLQNAIWIPDGKGIMAIGYSKKFGIQSAHNLFLYDIESKQWKQLTQYSGDSGPHSFDVFNDGKEIICSYSSDWAGKERGTYIINLETEEMKKITNWSGGYKIMPDQKSFIARRGIEKGKEVISMSEISLVNLETGEEKFLTRDGDLMKSTPTISPDGKKILYSAQTSIPGYEYGRERIFLINLETGEKVEVFDRKPGYLGKIPHDRSPDWHA